MAIKKKVAKKLHVDTRRKHVSAPSKPKPYAAPRAAVEAARALDPRNR
jgi:hypothetical protein